MTANQKRELQLLLGPVAVYVVLNLLFMSIYFISKDSLAFLFPAIENIAHKIPVIVKPVNWLMEHGNHERAMMVTYLYGFNWLSFIVLTPSFLMVNIYAVRHWVRYQHNL